MFLSGHSWWEKYLYTTGRYVGRHIILRHHRHRGPQGHIRHRAEEDIRSGTSFQGIFYHLIMSIPGCLASKAVSVLPFGCIDKVKRAATGVGVLPAIRVQVGSTPRRV